MTQEQLDTAKLIVRQARDPWTKLRLAIVAQAMRDTERIVRNGPAWSTCCSKDELIRFWQSRWAVQLTGLDQEDIDDILARLQRKRIW